MSEERKVGHTALRAKNGKLEIFDPHPNRTEKEGRRRLRKYIGQIVFVLSANVN